MLSFPAISCGVYGYPVAAAAEVAMAAVVSALEDHPGVERVRFWVFSDEAEAAFSRALADLR